MNRIKSLRVSNGMYQAELAKQFNIAVSTLSYWEQGKYEPDHETTVALANYFNVSTDYLLGNTDDPSPPNTKSPVYDDEALELMEEMHKRPELKVLFNTSKNAKKKDIELVDEMLKRMAGYDDD